MKLFEVPAPDRIPFYDLQIAAGDFSALEQAERVLYIEVEDRYSRSNRYFACHVIGESMNKLFRMDQFVYPKTMKVVPETVLSA